MPLPPPSYIDDGASFPRRLRPLSPSSSTTSSFSTPTGAYTGSYIDDGLDLIPPNRSPNKNALATHGGFGAPDPAFYTHREKRGTQPAEEAAVWTADIARAVAGDVSRSLAVMRGVAGVEVRPACGVSGSETETEKGEKGKGRRRRRKGTVRVVPPRKWGVFVIKDGDGGIVVVGEDGEFEDHAGKKGGKMEMEKRWVRGVRSGPRSLVKGRNESTGEMWDAGCKSETEEVKAHGEWQGGETVSSWSKVPAASKTSTTSTSTWTWPKHSGNGGDDGMDDAPTQFLMTGAQSGYPSHAPSSSLPSISPRLQPSRHPSSPPSPFLQSALLPTSSRPRTSPCPSPLLSPFLKSAQPASAINPHEITWADASPPTISSGSPPQLRSRDDWSSTTEDSWQQQRVRTVSNEGSGFYKLKHDYDSDKHNGRNGGGWALTTAVPPTSSRRGSSSNRPRSMHTVFSLGSRKSNYKLPTIVSVTDESSALEDKNARSVGGWSGKARLVSPPGSLFSEGEAQYKSGRERGSVDGGRSAYISDLGWSEHGERKKATTQDCWDAHSRTAGKQKGWGGAEGEEWDGFERPKGTSEVSVVGSLRSEWSRMSLGDRAVEHLHTNERKDSSMSGSGSRRRARRKSHRGRNHKSSTTKSAHQHAAWDDGEGDGFTPASPAKSWSSESDDAWDGKSSKRVEPNARTWD